MRRGSACGPTNFTNLLLVRSTSVTNLIINRSKLSVQEVGLSSTVALSDVVFLECGYTESVGSSVFDV